MEDVFMTVSLIADQVITFSAYMTIRNDGNQIMIIRESNCQRRHGDSDGFHGIPEG